MKYYIAGRYDRREELAGYAEELREKGHTVDCRWLLGLHQIHAHAKKVDIDNHPEHGVTIEARPFAQDDFEDVRASDTIVFFSEPPEAYSKRGGRHVEFGMALAWGKKLVVIGRRENVFHCLPQVQRYDTWIDFLLATPPTKREVINMSKKGLKMPGKIKIIPVKIPKGTEHTEEFQPPELRDEIEQEIKSIQDIIKHGCSQGQPYPWCEKNAEHILSLLTPIKELHEKYGMLVKYLQMRER